MKYIEDFRKQRFAKAISEKIAASVDSKKNYQFMEFCGGHTHAIWRYGIPSLLPKNVGMIHGPGCPVCILPIKIIDQAIALASFPHVILCSYGDLLRVPGSNQRSLLKAKAAGANVQLVYSADQALNLAKLNPKKEIVFFAIGFETSTPPTACVIKRAKKLGLGNFKVFCNHVLTPTAMQSLLQTDNLNLSGLIGPAHVSIIIGSNSYEAVSKKYNQPIVISGFEPLDILHSILMLIQQVNSKRCEVEIQYSRAVTRFGNLISQQIINEVFELREQFEWRGLGLIPYSALQINPCYSAFDAEKYFQLPQKSTKENRQCICASVLRGIKQPLACKLFAKACTPENPLGSCMVSSEGACAAVYAYGRIPHA